MSKNFKKSIDIQSARKCKRNSPCWCGSGGKFKKCHLNRHLEEKVNIAKASDQLSAIFSWKTCLYREVDADHCSGDIINAHSIQKSRPLKKIMDSKQEVLTFYFNNMFQTKYEMPRAMNWRRASVFTGFCRHHDSSLFAPLENYPFSRSQEQIFLGAYRALSHEYFLKTCGVESSKNNMKILDRGRSLEDQVRIQDFLAGHQSGLIAGLADLKHWKQKFDLCMKNKDFNKLSSLVIEVSGMFCVAASCATNPNYDFQGNKIQDFMDRNKVTQHVCISIEPKDTTIDIVIAWPQECESMKKFVDSMLRIDKNELPNILIQFLIRNSENVFFSKNWWNGLNELQKESLREDGADFGAYTDFRPYKNLQLVDWKYLNHVFEN